MDFAARAATLVGAKPSELEQWAHDAKVTLLAHALEEAFNEGAEEEADDATYTFGLFLPINGSDRSPSAPPIPAPQHEDLRLVRCGTGWGLLWVLAEEEGVPPLAASSINWFPSRAAEVGRRHILSHGWQYGEPLMVILAEGDDIKDLTRCDWKGKQETP